MKNLNIKIEDDGVKTLIDIRAEMNVLEILGHLEKLKFELLSGSIRPIKKDNDEQR